MPDPPSHAPLPETELRCIAPHPDFPRKRCNYLFGRWPARVVLDGTADTMPDADGRVWQHCKRCGRWNYGRILPLEPVPPPPASPLLPHERVGSQV